MPVDDEQLIKRLRELLETVDLETTSERKLRELLEAEYKEDLKDRKATIRQEVKIRHQDAAAMLRSVHTIMHT